MDLKCTAKCTEIYRKSKCQLFRDLKVGDIYDFSTELTAAGTSRWRTYATGIYCVNRRTGVSDCLTFNQLDRAMYCAEFEQINE